MTQKLFCYELLFRCQWGLSLGTRLLILFSILLYLLFCNFLFPFKYHQPLFILTMLPSKYCLSWLHKADLTVTYPRPWVDICDAHHPPSTVIIVYVAEHVHCPVRMDSQKGTWILKVFLNTYFLLHRVWISNTRKRFPLNHLEWVFLHMKHRVIFSNSSGHLLGPW